MQIVRRTNESTGTAESKQSGQLSSMCRPSSDTTSRRRFSSQIQSRVAIQKARQELAEIERGGVRVSESPHRSVGDEDEAQRVGENSQRDVESDLTADDEGQHHGQQVETAMALRTIFLVSNKQS